MADHLDLPAHIFFDPGAPGAGVTIVDLELFAAKRAL
jgi:hypothetical protein